MDCCSSFSDAVSFLCGALTGKKSSAPQSSVETEHPDLSPEKTSSQGRDSPEAAPSDQEEVQKPQPIPPPPGRQHHMRAASCHHHHSRSNSSMSKLTSSLSMRALTASRRDDSGGNNNKKLKHEDSIWKKTIILGEKCRVPDEDEDTILYDENGNRISAYHPKNNAASVSSLSRQTSCTDQDSVPPRLGPRN